MRLLAASAVLVPLALVACGDQTSDPGAGPAAWTAERLAGEQSVDFPTVLATSGDDALVLMVSDDGALQSHVSVDGGPFERGEPLDTGSGWISLGGAVRLADGSWYALGSGGVEVVDGDEESRHDPFAFRSEDGLVWERVEVSGFRMPFDVGALAVVDGTVVAAGSYRTEEDPGTGGFEARVWTSHDGRSFREVELPGVPAYDDYDDESYAGELATTGDRLLVAGRVGRYATVWSSSDGGRAWDLVDDPLLRTAYSISGLRASGRTVVASVSGSDTSAIRSTDGGATWEPVEALPLDEEAEGWAPLWAGGGRFLTLTGVDDLTWSSPEVCYADLDQCGRQPEPALVSSTDGAAWTTVDTAGLREVDQVAGTDDGRLLVLTGEGRRLTVHTWPAGAPLPDAAEQAVPETVELVTLGEDETPAVGVRYHHPLYTHCGIDWVWFGDATWRRTDDGPEYETGAGDEAPEGWPVPAGGGNVYGYATLLEDGTMEYTDEDGTVLATYERRERALACM